MSELRRYLVQQWTVDGWVELARFDRYEDADELAMSVKAGGAVGVRVWDAGLGRTAWSGVGGGR